MNCQRCGTPLNEKARFCSDCGTPAPRIDTGAPDICENCTAPLRPGMHFCESCGAPVTYSWPERKPVSAPVCVQVAEPVAHTTDVTPEPAEEIPDTSSAEKSTESPRNLIRWEGFHDVNQRLPQEMPFEAGPQDSENHMSPVPQVPTAGGIRPYDSGTSYGNKMPPVTQRPPVGIMKPYDQKPPHGSQPAQPQITGDKNIKGNQIGVLVAVLTVVVLCVGLASAIVFDLFGFRNALNNVISTFAPNETSVSEVSGAEPEISGSQLPEQEESGPEQAVNTSTSFSAELSISPKFYDVTDFDDYGYARVYDGNGWGVIDRGGNYIVEPSYNYIYEFSEGYALIEKAAEDTWLYGLVDRDGKIVIQPEWEDAQIFTEGLLAVCKNGKYGFINLEGEIVIPLQYDYAYGFEDGYAAVQSGENCYFIDSSGNIVSQYYQDARSFSEGYAAVKLGGLWGYVDFKFNVAVPCVYYINEDYDDVEYFNEGVVVIPKGDKYVFVDGDGVEVSSELDGLWEYTNGYAVAQNGDGFGLLDMKTHDFIIQPQYYDEYFYSDGMLPVTSDGKEWYYVDVSNVAQLDNMKFDEAWPFYNGIAGVLMDKSYGLIDLDGNFVSEYQWDYLRAYSGGMIAVEKDGLWGFLSIDEK